MDQHHNPYVNQPQLHEDQWASYFRDGFIHLDRVLSIQEVEALQRRIDQIMLGEADVDYGSMMMQLDSETGRYADAGKMTKGHKGPTLSYRKIEQLEFDPLFLRYMQKPIFQEICARVYGGHTPISSYRAMFMNKPANQGTILPWHQDRWSSLDRDPLITVWTALDPATIENGCVQVIRGSHRWGVINPAHNGGFLEPDQTARYVQNEKILHCTMGPGEAMLMHNWLLHSSDKNASRVSRRAFSVCYMDARTKTVPDGEQVGLRIFGDGAMNPQSLHLPK